MPVEYPNRRDPKVGEKTVEGIIVGRNKAVIPPQEVYQLAAIGCKDIEIAEWFGISEQSVRYNFKEQLVTGREAIKQSLRRAQLRLALSGNATMLIWLGKNILGQTEQGLNGQGTEPLPWIEADVTDVDSSVVEAAEEK